MVAPLRGWIRSQPADARRLLTKALKGGMDIAIVPIAPIPPRPSKEWLCGIAAQVADAASSASTNRTKRYNTSYRCLFGNMENRMQPCQCVMDLCAIKSRQGHSLNIMDIAIFYFSSFDYTSLFSVFLFLFLPVLAAAIRQTRTCCT